MWKWLDTLAQVFEKECSSPEFEKNGKQIALKCGGLPLAITVIAGLLSKIGKTLDEWKSVSENVSAVLSLDWNYLRNHEPTEKSTLVLKNLECLSGWNPWYCTSSDLRLFPKLKKLQLCGVQEDFCSRKDLYDIRYLDKLEELEFRLSYTLASFFLESITPSGPLRFQREARHCGDPVPPLLLSPLDAVPQNLKKLIFSGQLHAMEGFQHCCLCLDSIPQDFADITTLALIDICRCAQSVGNSAKQIQQDMEDNYASSIEVHIR
ncbi:hypothetical protein KY290_036327 [Solanum tuberosum]|uniref:NB-ARC domain-containing protein n=1 Tax=Solanum tuberosum TaxID=4113 RepID=A0ABQ7TSC6_SOLTU|nr:hypothetical protein KY285_035615 [Solanum tuberosum]KAH0737622.1 hypothetical protein KY290_036327 [Solanum tuberosum]